MFIINLSPSEIDFTRNRQFPLKKLLKIMLLIGSGSLQNELLKYYNFTDDVPTKSAFCQQQDKILPEVVNFLFASFTEKLDALKLFREYRALAVDGSDIIIL